MTEKRGKKMKRFTKILSFLLAALLFAACLPAIGLPQAEAAEEGKWIATWSTSLVDASVTLSGVDFQDVIPTSSTLRTEITVTTAGTKLRFAFSNQYGSLPITINGASVARTDGQYQAKIVDGTQKAITFGGGKSVVIPAGQRVISDVVDYETKALDKLSISLYLENTYFINTAGLSNGRTYMNAGGLLFGKSKINEPSLPNAMEISLGSGTITYHTIPFLEEIDSFSPSKLASTAVFIGDSTLVNDTYLNYARRVVSAGRTDISIINKAIIGNKLLSDGSGIIGKLYGEALIDRFQRDVLDVPNVKYCFVKIGLNDVLHQFSKSLAGGTPKYTAEEIIAGYKTLVTLAHQKGISIYFFTKSPWKGYQRAFLGQTDDLSWNQTAQDMCDKLSEWVRTNTMADGFIDCSPLADPTDRTKLCSSLTLDGAHLSDLGSVALADLTPLEYVGIVSRNGKTAASIMNVDPYAEKNAILNRQNQPATTAANNNNNTAAPATQEPTKQAVPQTSIVYVPVSTTAGTAATTPATTAALSPYTEPAATTSYVIDAESVTGEPYTTDAYYATSPTVTGTPNQGVDYVVVDDGLDGEPAQLGSGAPIAFILILLLVLMIAAAVVILTIGKKKEEFEG